MQNIESAIVHRWLQAVFVFFSKTHLVSKNKDAKQKSCSENVLLYIFNAHLEQIVLYLQNTAGDGPVENTTQIRIR